MKRGFVVLAVLLSLTACSGQQIQEAALFTAGAVLKTAIEIDEVIDERDRSERCRESVFEETAPALSTHGAGACSPAARRREKARHDAVLEAAEAHRTAQRRAELNAALDAYMAPASDAESEQRSVLVAPVDRAVPQNVVERFNAVVTEPPLDD